MTHQETADGGEQEEEGEGAERTEVREMNKGDGLTGQGLGPCEILKKDTKMTRHRAKMEESELVFS